MIPYNYEANAASPTTVNMYGCTYTGSTRKTWDGVSAPIHMCIDSQYGSIKMNIYDPVFDNLSWTYGGTTVVSGKLIVHLHPTYQGVANKQLASDIKVYQNGVDVTASKLQVIVEAG